MIYDLYVISSQSGICIYHKGFGTTLINSDLVAGLLSAMFSFMKEVRGDQMKIMMSGNSKFVFGDSSKLIFVALVDLNQNEGEVSGFLEGVKKLFAERYSEDAPIPALSEDDPISQDITPLLFASSKSTDQGKRPLGLGHRLTKLVAPELMIQRDAIATLFKRIAKDKQHQREYHELEEKYRKEIENLNQMIEETER
jgi:hypothetical protein